MEKCSEKYEKHQIHEQILFYYISNKFMIMKELNLKQFNAPVDASDALAIALCHIYQVRLEEL